MDMTTYDKVDTEWEQLILDAMNLGLSAEEIRDFLNTQSIK